MEPSIVSKKKFNVIGLSDEFGQDNNKSVVDLWKKVGCRYPEIHNTSGRAYGLCLKGSPESFTYMASFEVDDLSDTPSDMESLVIEEAEYAVFTFTVDNKSPIGAQFSKVYQGIWGNWLPNSDYEYADTPDFELYDDRFDGSRATGEVDIWIPVTKKTLSA